MFPRLLGSARVFLVQHDDKGGGFRRGKVPGHKDLSLVPEHMAV